MRRCSAPFRFQSPSLRGSGRFRGPRRKSAHDGRRKFQSPSLRGSGRFEAEARARAAERRAFQSPSLRGSGRFEALLKRLRNVLERFNPLHCGAVVASGRRRPMPSSSPPCFNPLHCGAVVASGGADRRGLARRMVSIPFIAGQWSLLRPASTSCRPSPSVSIPFIAGQWSLRNSLRPASTSCRFQSPSLRGSGRFGRGGAVAPARPAGFNPLHCGAVVASLSLAWGSRVSTSKFQSPSLRGSGRFRDVRGRETFWSPVSIPFIAGQWSLPRGLGKKPGRRREFQSPSLRGSGRFPHGGRDGKQRHGKFQSPSLRGSGRFAWWARREEASREGFNPLHCGAVVASPPPHGGGARRRSFSIPFIAGQWSLQYGVFGVCEWRYDFQSPSLRGSGRFRSRGFGTSNPGSFFNPLHCGAVVASHGGAQRKENI